MHENEAISRIHQLRETAKIFFDKSMACTKISDVQAFFSLAQQANESADALESDLKIESCWTYLHFVQFFGYSDQYHNYLEFCVRNRINPVSKLDLKAALSYKKIADTAKMDNSVMAVQ